MNARPPAPLAGTLCHAQLARLGLRAGDVLDACTAHNREPLPEPLRAAVSEACFERHPDPHGLAARTQLAEAAGLQPHEVLLGGDTSQLAERCARAWLSAGSVVLSIEPSQAEFARAARGCGARVVRWRSVERTGHRVDLEQIAELMQLERPQVVSLSAPGDPTGASVPLQQLSELAGRFADTRFVVDQSWLELSDDWADGLQLPAPNVVCLRSLSHSFGLPGLGAAYALCQGALAEHIGPQCTATAAAQAALAAAPGARAFLDASRARLQSDRARLGALLDQLGLAFTPSAAPFVLVRVARAEEVSLELLEQHKLAVCDATPSGLPDHLRIAAISEAAAPQLMAALSRVLTRRGLVRGREP